MLNRFFDMKHGDFLLHPLHSTREEMKKYVPERKFDEWDNEAELVADRLTIPYWISEPDKVFQFCLQRKAGEEHHQGFGLALGLGVGVYVTAVKHSAVAAIHENIANRSKRKFSVETVALRRLAAEESSRKRLKRVTFPADGFPNHCI